MSVTLAVPQRGGKVHAIVGGKTLCGLDPYGDPSTPNPAGSDWAPSDHREPTCSRCLTRWRQRGW